MARRVRSQGSWAPYLLTKVPNLCQAFHDPWQPVASLGPGT
jgi:hypothetical protein